MALTQSTYSIPAIKTVYRGIEFDSRLEAKWAAFFDVLGCDWEYHPCDLPGWFPDFQAFGVLCEVKPFTELCPATAQRMAHAMYAARVQGVAVLLGRRPYGLAGDAHFWIVPAAGSGRSAGYARWPISDVELSRRWAKAHNLTKYRR